MNESREFILDVKDLTVELDLGAAHGKVTVLNSVSFQVRPGEVLGIVGESGSGKTLTALSIAGLLPANARMTGGRITFGGRNLQELDEKQISKVRATELAVIFQDPTSFLNPVMRVGDQIAEILTDNPELLGADGDNAKRSRSEIRKLAWAKSIEYLTQVRISDPERVATMYPHELSGGMQQRILIAAAIARKPKLVIADEITSSLDVTVQAQILGLIAQLERTLNLTMILITHDLGIIAQIADRALVLYSGRVLELTNVKALFSDPKHPYTKALMKAVPTVSRGQTILQSIPGSVPSIVSPPAGCRYHPRCPYAFARCREESPEPVDVGGTLVACHLFTGEKG